MPAHPSPVQKVVLVELRDNTRWELSFGAEPDPGIALLRGPDNTEVSFSRAQIGATCDLVTRDDACQVTMPTPGRVRTFRCSVDQLQPLLDWIRADLASFEGARVARELLLVIPLGILWILIGSPVLSHGYSRWLIGYGIGLVVLGVIGRFRPHRYLLVADAALWFALTVQNARVAYAGSGALAVVMTLFTASYGFRVLRVFAFQRALAQK